MKFDLGPHVASLVMSTPPLCLDKVFMCRGGGSASFGMKFQGPLPRPLISGAPCSNKDTSRRSRSKSQGQDNTREDKTGQHKTRQDWTGQGNTRQDRARQDWPRSKCQEKDQMSRGILPLSDPDWGEFLLTFELGLISLF